jgi:peptide chain release factor 2
MLQDASAWDDHAALAPTLKELAELQDTAKTLDETRTALELLSQDPETQDEEMLFDAQRKIARLETKRLFTGKFDRHDAIVSIYAGAGGQDAGDWAHMLFDMYSAYAAQKKWKVSIIDVAQESAAAKTGRVPFKSIAFEVAGDYAFGYLKRESGVHRLVRVSPFSAQQLRHTSFALVEVIPKFQETVLHIKEEDLRVEFTRSSGPGGQNVNKVETAVRMTHIPTGLVASSQVERSQSQNRERALHILEGKLLALMEKERVEQLENLKTNAKPEWGSQIRSYVLNPYKLVKDHRTEYETSQVDKVLEEGDLDGFIEAELIQEAK